jgi:hypothetical protein
MWALFESRLLEAALDLSWIVTRRVDLLSFDGRGGYKQPNSEKQLHQQGAAKLTSTRPVGFPQCGRRQALPGS